MVAEALPARTRLPLLFEPYEPDIRKKAEKGWRMTFVIRQRARLREAVRYLPDDAVGALAQHAIVRYLVRGVARKVIARETGYSERQIQAWFGGKAWTPYTQPVLDALDELGIRSGKGKFRAHGAHRMHEIAAAQERLLTEAARLLDSDDRAASRRLRQRIRLLSAGKEPLTP